MSCVHRTKDGVCRKCSAGKYVAYCPDGPCPEQVVTNGDRIRAMTDEELAELLTAGKGGFDCFVCQECVGDCDINCEEQCLRWLGQPVEEKDHE